MVVPMQFQTQIRSTKPHLAAEVALPELAVSSAAGHGAQQEGIDLDHLLDCL
jgi:hypothetical protein